MRLFISSAGERFRHPCYHLGFVEYEGTLSQRILKALGEEEPLSYSLERLAHLLNVTINTEDKTYGNGKYTILCRHNNPVFMYKTVIIRGKPVIYCTYLLKDEDLKFSNI